MRFFLVQLTILLLANGCCPTRKEPEWPGQLKGWDDVYIGTTHFVGQFVLKKDEATDNGKIGVKVIDIIPPERCGHPGTYDGSPKAIISFFRPSDNQEICKVTLVGDQKNSTLHCDPSLGLSVIGVNAINTTDKWIFFDLRE